MKNDTCRNDACGIESRLAIVAIPNTPDHLVGGKYGAGGRKIGQGMSGGADAC